MSSGSCSRPKCLESLSKSDLKKRDQEQLHLHARQLPKEPRKSDVIPTMACWVESILFNRVFLIKEPLPAKRCATSPVAVGQRMLGMTCSCCVF